MGVSRSQRYKVKLENGRVLGPLDIDRVRKLIAKNQIKGSELARVYPEGEWKEIDRIPELADLIIEKLENRLSAGSKEQSPQVYDPVQNPKSDVGPTVLLPGTEEASAPSLVEADDSLPSIDLNKITKLTRTHEKASKKKERKKEENTEQMDATVVDTRRKKDKGAVVRLEKEEVTKIGEVDDRQRSPFSHLETVIFQKKNYTPVDEEESDSRVDFFMMIKVLIIGLLFGYFGYDYVFDDEAEQVAVVVKPVRANMPNFIETRANPSVSEKYLKNGMQFYVFDHVKGYRKALWYFSEAAKFDKSNVRALAMLASSYLNLIDSSNKDENYFSTIQKLIDMSKAASLEFEETVIAEVEFYVTIGRYEIAQERIVEYSKTHKGWDQKILYYLAYVSYARGQYREADEYLKNFDNGKVFSPKVYYLRGQVYEKFGNTDRALQEYVKAITLTQSHALSHLRIVNILYQQGRLKESKERLGFLIENIDLLSPLDKARAFFLYGQMNILEGKWAVALGAIEKAMKLDKKNSEYLVSYYTLRNKEGDRVESVKPLARMYWLLGEGEALAQQGRYREALIKFQEARHQNVRSHIPLSRIGDMQMKLHDLDGALFSYREASKTAKRSPSILAKYVEALIFRYELDEAKAVIKRLQRIPNARSLLRRLAGETFARQGQHEQALILYRKAMGYRTIDPDVYLAYAKSLLALNQFKDAQLFFAIVRRIDPHNMDAIIGTSKTIAKETDARQAIRMLEQESAKMEGERVEIVTAIAELQIQAGDFRLAEETLKKAIMINKDYSIPYKLQADLYYMQKDDDKKAVDRALAAYESYSRRNQADPSGFLKRYEVFLNQASFEKAKQELDRIYLHFPKYPGLHYLQGAFYTAQGDHLAATSEYKLELKNHPTSVEAMMALGKELLKIGDLQEAIKQFSLAMSYSQNSSQPRYFAAEAYYLLKNYQAAIALYLSALEFEKGDPLIYRSLGRAYYYSGDRLSAAKYFKRYLEIAPDAPDRKDIQQLI